MTKIEMICPLSMMSDEIKACVGCSCAFGLLITPDDFRCLLGNHLLNLNQMVTEERHAIAGLTCDHKLKDKSKDDFDIV